MAKEENLKKSENSCSHKEWRIITGSSGDRNGICECLACHLWMTHAEMISWKALKNQKSVSFVSIVLSIIAIIVSIISLVISN